MPRHKSVATNAEVARRASVSPATVSRVMNGIFAGEPEVADRVREVARKLGYQPNYLARSLALGHTSAVAFVVPDLGNPAFQQILSGLSRAAAEDGHRVLIADSAEAVEAEPMLATETRRRCDALVLCAPRMPDQHLREVMASVHPAVLINRSIEDGDVPSLSIDYANGILNLARHLYRLGHREFAYLAGSEGSVSNAKRLGGLVEFEAEQPDVSVQRLQGGVTAQAGRDVAESVLEAGVTAVLAFNDLVAIGLSHRLRELGVQVPEDISITGFDDIPFAQFNHPPLTTASVPYEKLGTEAWHRLAALMQGSAPNDNRTYQPRLQVRGSTARVG